jgi:8-oxo-dGTP pyrophosphatase MutT (NUDIX family)
MKVGPWEILKREAMAETRIFSMEKRRCRSRATHVEADFVVLNSRDWVNIVALTKSEHIVLIKQYRAGTDEVTLEIPGGVCDPGENPVQAGQRELREETGFTAEACRLLGLVRPNPAFLSNRCYTVLATGCDKKVATNFDHDEEIETIEVPLNVFSERIRNGDIDHSLVWSAYVHMLHAGIISIT